MNDKWFSLNQVYRSKKMFLDVAQLIKHSIGLINYKHKTQKNVILVYIFWTPNNSELFPEYLTHTEELKEFNEKINSFDDLKFVSMTYDQFWENDSNSEIFKGHYVKVKGRYKIEI